jgi:enoyl-CoA hydratase
MTTPAYVRIDRAADHAVVTVDRPEKMNALNPDVLGQLDRAFDELRRDRDVRGIVLTGAGDKAFVAGADVGLLAELDPLEGVETSRRGQEVLQAIEGFPKPVVAAVGGYALGGGCELAMACHLRVAAEDARFGLPEVGLGVIPGYGGTIRLARLVGLGRAIEMTLTGDLIGAERALEIGLVTAVCPRDQLLATAVGTLGRITRNGPVAVRLALESIYRALDGSTVAALELEASLFGLLASTRDMKEGTAAFLEKRKPSFEGR